MPWMGKNMPESVDIAAVCLILSFIGGVYTRGELSISRTLSCCYGTYHIGSVMLEDITTIRNCLGSLRVNAP